MEGVLSDLLDWARGHLEEFTMVKAYLACAVAGGSILLAQTGLNLFGLGGDGDVDPDVDVDDLEGADSLNFISIRALAGFLTFFGLVGWGGTASGWGSLITVFAAFAGGSSVMLLVAWIMRFFRRMGSEGNLDPENAVGQTARVYLAVPGEHSGKGKITLTVQGRSAEFEAVTAGEALPSGSECQVVRRLSEGTFEVAALDLEAIS